MTKKGKEEFALNLLNAINLKLEALEEEPAIESSIFLLCYSINTFWIKLK